MNLTDDGSSKIFKIPGTIEYLKITEGVVIGQFKNNCIYIIPELSDATPNQVINYNKALYNIKNINSIQSDFCDIDTTSILRINNTNLKTCDTNTIISLCAAGVRTEQMLLLNDSNNGIKIVTPDKSFKEKITHYLEQYIPMINPELATSILRQYCWKFGNVNFFGWAEKVYVQEFLLKKK
jgi:hypothetical protein